jgi:hypothetical protein
MILIDLSINWKIFLYKTLFILLRSILHYILMNIIDCKNGHTAVYLLHDSSCIVSLFYLYLCDWFYIYVHRFLEYTNKMNEMKCKMTAVTMRGTILQDVMSYIPLEVHQHSSSMLMKFYQSTQHHIITYTL